MFKFLSCLVSPGFIGIVILEFEMKCKIKLISLRSEERRVGKECQ